MSLLFRMMRYSFSCSHAVRFLKNADFIISANIDYSNFFRFDNTLVLYTFDFPRNEYGYELLVEKNSNCVIDRGERLDITPDTYILSGHGEAAEFLKQVQIGDIVNIERNELTVTRDLKISNLIKVKLFSIFRRLHYLNLKGL